GGQASRSRSAAGAPIQGSRTAPCSRVAAPNHAHATPPHPLANQPPKQHNRQAARPPHDPTAQQQQPATRSRDQPALPRSPQAQCGSRAPYPDGPHAPQTPKPHRRASAPSPPCGTSVSPQHHTGPQQNAPPSDPRAQRTHAQPQPPQCKAPQQHQQELAPNNHPIHKSACSRSGHQSARLPESSPLDYSDMR